MKKWIKRLTPAVILVILTVVVCSIPVFAEEAPSADCLVTLRADREGFEDRELFVPMGTTVPAAAFRSSPRPSAHPFSPSPSAASSRWAF